MLDTSATPYRFFGSNKSVKFRSQKSKASDVCIMQNKMNMDDALVSRFLISRQSSTESRTRPAREITMVLLLETQTDTSSSFSEQRVKLGNTAAKQTAVEELQIPAS